MEIRRILEFLVIERERILEMREEERERSFLKRKVIGGKESYHNRLRGVHGL